MRRIRLSRKATGILALAALGAPAAAYADFFVHHWDLRRERYQDARFGLSVPIFLSSQNYGTDGTQFQPPGFDSLTRSGLDADLDYGLGDRFTIYGRLTWAWERVKADQRGGTAYGFADQTAGASFRLFDSESFALDFQSQVDFAVYDNHAADNDRTPYLGDGTLDITFGGSGRSPSPTATQARSISFRAWASLSETTASPPRFLGRSRRTGSTLATRASPHVSASPGFSR
ncbi:MAG: hypothetical protein QM765_44430 [Myxococcales bacterium]